MKRAPLRPLRRMMVGVMRTDRSIGLYASPELIASGVVGTVILGAVKCKLGDEAFVHQARADAFVDGLQSDVVGCDYGWKARVVAIIEQLEEFFAGPG